MTALAESVGTLWRFRELLALLVTRDLKVRYKRSVLGMFWTLLNPLLQMLVYTLVFRTIMRVQIPAFPVFLLSGLLPWTLVAVSATASAHSLLANQGLIRKVAVPQAVWPLAVVGSKLVDLLFSLLPLALLAGALGRMPGASWLALVPGLACAIAFTAGLSLLFSSLTVFFRDVRHLIDILFQVWFYLTPVLYPQSYLDNVGSPLLRRVLSLNPAAPIVRVFQEAIYEQRFPSGALLAQAALFGFGTLAIGWSVFRRGQDRHIHHF
ncbi:MAG TPA: ABC transporter permease [Anaeromyxobacteraceae bacterium]|nr:ABC transporter permease [Anaeromyxobacteraceae bacterium]